MSNIQIPVCMHGLSLLDWTERDFTHLMAILPIMQKKNNNVRPGISDIISCSLLIPFIKWITPASLFMLNNI